MTQSQLDRSVARRTGEPLSVVRRLGFQAAARRRDGLEAEDFHLAVDCPFCGGGIPLPPAPGGPPSLAGCPHCEVEFDVAPDDIYVAGPGLGRPPRRRIHVA